MPLGPWASSEDVEAVDVGCRMARAATRAVIWLWSGLNFDGHLLLHRPFVVFLVDDKLDGLGLGLTDFCLYGSKQCAWAAGLFGA